MSKSQDAYLPCGSRLQLSSSGTEGREPARSRKSTEGQQPGSGQEPLVSRPSPTLVSGMAISQPGRPAEDTHPKAVEAGCVAVDPHS